MILHNIGKGFFSLFTFCFLFSYNKCFESGKCWIIFTNSLPFEQETLTNDMKWTSSSSYNLFCSWFLFIMAKQWIMIIQIYLIRLKKINPFPFICCCQATEEVKKKENKTAKEKHEGYLNTYHHWCKLGLYFLRLCIVESWMSRFVPHYF